MKKKKKLKKTKAPLIKEKSVRFLENNSQNEKNIKNKLNRNKEASSDYEPGKNEHVNKILENEKFNTLDGENENEDEEENV